MVSIIVPVYNASATLQKCVDSILQQSFKDFEVLLIDDGSSDNSDKICNEYIQKDKRVRVFHKINDGVSSARNCGLQHVCGKWIVFVDSDDWLEKDFLLNLMKYADYQFIVGGFKRFGEKSDEAKPKVSQRINVKKDLTLLFESTLDKFIFWYVWGKLFRKDIIEEYHIKFYENMKYNEDNCFVLEYMSHIDNFMYVSTSEYIHLFENKRAKKYKMNFVQFKEHISQQEKSFLQLEKKTQTRFVLVRQNVHRRFFDSLVYYLLSDTNNISYQSELKQFKEFDTNHFFLNEVSYTFKRKLLRWVLFDCPWQIGYILKSIILRIAYSK